VTLPSRAPSTDWIPAPDLFDAEGYRAFSTADPAELSLRQLG